MGVDTAGQLLVSAGGNPEGSAPSDPSPAPVRRRADPGVLRPHRPHRLHRGSDRLANSALWRMALVRMHCYQPIKNYVARRTAEGKTKTEIPRCLKRYIAREV